MKISIAVKGSAGTVMTATNAVCQRGPLAVNERDDRSYHLTHIPTGWAMARFESRRGAVEALKMLRPFYQALACIQTVAAWDKWIKADAARRITIARIIVEAGGSVESAGQTVGGAKSPYGRH
jgi:hypothetical protein